MELPNFIFLANGNIKTPLCRNFEKENHDGLIVNFPGNNKLKENLRFRNPSRNKIIKIFFLNDLELV